MTQEPAWWADARRLYENPRLSIRAVGRLLKKTNTSILYAVNPEHRARKRKRVNAYNAQRRA